MSDYGIATIVFGILSSGVCFFVLYGLWVIPDRKTIYVNPKPIEKLLDMLEDRIDMNDDEELQEQMERVRTYLRTPADKEGEG